MSKEPFFLFLVLAASSLILSLAVLLPSSSPLCPSLSVSLVLPVLCRLNHSSGSLRGRLPHSFPLALPFSSLPSPGLKIGQLIIKQSRRAPFPWEINYGMKYLGNSYTYISCTERDRGRNTDREGERWEIGIILFLFKISFFVTP